VRKGSQSSKVWRYHEHLPSCLPRKALGATHKYHISVLTRDPSSAKSLTFKIKFPQVNLLKGSYTTEAGLRTALENQDVVYFNMDSFSVGEPQEYFWTFRAYEIAVQSGVKWFIYSGARENKSLYGLQEKYRNSHNIVAGRLSGWLMSQPLERLPWTIITGGIYVEMLGSMLKPVRVGDSNTLTFRAPVDHESVLPLIPLEMYGFKVQSVLENPKESFGQTLSAGAPIFQVTYPQITAALESVVKEPVRFESISIAEWMENINEYIDPEGLLPRGASADDPTTFTFRKTFSAWWNIWRDNRASLIASDLEWADDVYPDRPKNLKEWMEKVGYTGELARLY
jgi:hypothetical protein